MQRQNTVDATCFSSIYIFFQAVSCNENADITTYNFSFILLHTLCVIATSRCIISTIYRITSSSHA